MTGDEFFLGTDREYWLWQLPVPLFVSARTLRGRKLLRPALCRWGLDSGGFTELTKYGWWLTPAARYAEEAVAWQAEIGPLAFAAPQDWMCEPHMLAKTGLTVREHQWRTINSYLELRTLAPAVPWCPVLQGWHRGDYLDHVEQYAVAGVDLAACPVVGLGSVCRRQSTGMAEDLIRELHGMGIRLHGFGFKLLGLLRVTQYLHSSDSMACSRDARWAAPLPECRGVHLHCSGCRRWALAWRSRVVERVDRVAAGMTQSLLF